MPAIFELFKKGMLPEKFAVLGTSSSVFSDDRFRENMKASIISTDKEADAKELDGFLKTLNYFPANFTEKDTYLKIAERMKALDNTCGNDCNYIFYLATIPGLFQTIISGLGEAGLNKSSNGYRRIVVEKPFGYDLISAKALNDGLHKVFNEQAYRIDHCISLKLYRTCLLQGLLEYLSLFGTGITFTMWNHFG
jgi:glucose-6-phosphate 1-dehydrogenase